MTQNKDNQNGLSDEEQTISIEQALSQAVGYHNAGRFSEAEKYYRHILDFDPNQPIALHLLGVLAQQARQTDLAIELISKAVANKPDYFKAHSNLGNVYREIDKFERAIECFRKAIEIEPKYAEAHSNLGNVLIDLAQWHFVQVFYCVINQTIYCKVNNICKIILF